MKKIFIIALLLVFAGQMLFAEDDIEEYLNQIGSSESVDYMKSYMQPLSTALSTAMGGALYHRAYTKGFPRMDIGISVAYVGIPEDDKKFLTVAGDEVATIFGSGSSAIKGFDESVFLIPYLHANVGLVASLEATARFTTVNIDYLGDLTIYGAGLKYDLSDMLPLPLIDLSAQAMYHKFTLGDLMDAGTFSMNLQASVSIPVLPIDVYGGLGLDNSTLEITTEKLDPDPGFGNIRIDGENSVRLNIGISYTMMMINIHADYNIWEYKSIGAGLMVVL